MKTASSEKPLELAVVVEGKVVKNNFPEFRDQLLAHIEAINTELTTDEDFGQAKADADKLGELEKTLDAAMDEILKNFEEVSKIQDGINDLKAQSKEKRLALSKLVTARADEIKGEIVADGIKRLKLRSKVHRELVEGAIARKRSLATMRDAVNEVVDHLNARVEKNQGIIDEAREKHGEMLVYGEGDLLGMTESELKVELDRRLERINADREKQKLREEAEKAKAEAEKAKAGNTPPAPQKIGSIPVGESAKKAEAPEAQPEAPAAAKELAQEGATVAEEMTHFQNVVLLAMAPVKDARKKLRHAQNVERAEAFAKDLGAAWTKFLNSTKL